MTTKTLYLNSPQRAFVDTNVLANIVGSYSSGLSTVNTLKNSNYEIVTSSKCVYELYSFLKGTTKSGIDKTNHPLGSLLTPEINDIAQKLFKKSQDIDSIGNSYYWYNLSEEWTGWDYFENMESKIDSIFLEKQKEFVKWKQSVLSAFTNIDEILKAKSIYVCEYFQIFSSEWYNKYGFVYERELAKNSLFPNEDFEIVIAALFLQAKVFITQDEDLLWRGALSYGFNMPNMSFCCVEKLQEAIEDDFAFRFYRKEKDKQIGKNNQPPKRHKLTE